MKRVLVMHAGLLGLAAQTLTLAPPSPFAGSVPSGSVSPEPVALSLSEAIRLGLARNLGAVLASEGERAAEGDRILTLARLLPNLRATVDETSQQINLRAYGFQPFPGIPSVVGPYGLFDARLRLSSPILNLRSLYSHRASNEQERAARLSAQDARDSIVMLVAYLYWQAVAGFSRIEAGEVQVAAAEALERQATDQKEAGLLPAIDVLRSQVELQAERQRLIADQNEFEKQKLHLAQAIGIPAGQMIRLTDALDFAPPAPLTPEEATERADQTRTDILSQAAKVKAAEMARKSILGASRPSLAFDGDYGVLGPHPAYSHGTYTAKLSLNVPIYASGAEKGALMQADAEWSRQKAQLEELRARAGFEIRAAMLDLKATSEQVQVNQNAVALAEQQLGQARDRFAAGVTNSLEVVQAQQGLATARENRIASLFAFNLAKVSLARAMGGTERNLADWGKR